MEGYRDRYGLAPAAERALRHLFACGTGELGVHDCVCGSCGWAGVAGNSCRDRHCPRCQGGATDAWLARREKEMLAVPHFQVVFTLPAELRPVARRNPALVYELLFQAGLSVLQDLARQKMGARLGITAVLHTWTSDLHLHPHVHCLVTAGGLSLDEQRWVPAREGFLFSQKILGRMFRGRFLHGLIEALDGGKLVAPGEPPSAERDLRATLRALSKRHARWVVHVEPPRGRPAEQVARYLARYVKRIAISDPRIVAFDDRTVTFRTKTGPATVDGPEFVRRFLLHLLPKGFRKVRHVGLYAPGRSKDRLARARELAPVPSAVEVAEVEGLVARAKPVGESCPACGEARVQRFFRDAPKRSRASARGPP